MNTMEEWKKLSQKYLLETKWLSVRKDSYKTPAGKIIDDFYIVERPDFVVIVPRTVEKKFVLVEQYRHGVERPILNFPMGFVEKNEEPIKTAVRELVEETGFSGNTIEFIGSFFLAPPFTKTIGHVFFADGIIKRDEINRGDFEINGIVLADQSQIEHFIKTDKLNDLVSVCSYLLVKNKKLLISY